MIKIIVHSSDTRINDVDYIIEKSDKLERLLPYLKKKLQGEWRIALLEPGINFVRRVYDEGMIPDYVSLEIYLEKSVASQLMAERPQLQVKEETAYEKFLHLISDMKVLIDPKAVRELYRRVGSDKSKLVDYVRQLADDSGGRPVTLSDVKAKVIDERKLYASQVVTEFLLGDRWRWKHYSQLLLELGRDYAYYAMRKYTEKLLQEKEKYLRNEPTTIFSIDRIDSYRISHAWVLFHTTTSKELDSCMYILDHREEIKDIL